MHGRRIMVHLPQVADTETTEKTRRARVTGTLTPHTAGRARQVADIEKAEKDKMKDKVKAICGHGINCFVNRQLVYNYPEELFADAGIMAIEHADFDGIERLALVTGAFLAGSLYVCMHARSRQGPGGGPACSHECLLHASALSQ